ncbi:hypothetical protein Nepgr_024568 [Nepenthes gracilis]|uniref:DUF4005 domain-containing protein n=1 Tax=Nepenthes gracilis TaxID=150966 RepID=A0AAD3Y068_NEPGR|nr:hypothetical protein Nepgr_024568 [Nepenthes gracilis]
MGRAAKWFKGLLGLKRSDPPSTTGPDASKHSKDKRRWSFVKSYKEKSSQQTAARSAGVTRQGNFNGSDVRATKTASGNLDGDDAYRHAIAVAASTAAVAEAALAAAQAASVVVRLTSGGRCNPAPQFYPRCRAGVPATEASAAVVIQSHFRGYLARRALRALKGLVKLQALVRGHILRKRTTETMRCMQAMLRAQARARAVRAPFPESPHSIIKSSQFHHPGPTTPEKLEPSVGAMNTKRDQSPKIRRNSSRSNNGAVVDKDRAYYSSSRLNSRTDELLWDRRGPSVSADDDRTDRILEIDTGKPRYNTKCRSLLESPNCGLASDQTTHSYTTSKGSTAHQTVASANSYELQSSNLHKLSCEVLDSGSFCTAESSLRFNSASSRGGNTRRGPGTPTKSDGSTSFFSGCSDGPSYMAYTESARAKVRSLSAPRQRPHYESVGSTKRYSVHGFGDSRLSAPRGWAVPSSFTGKAYPGSGRLDRFGMPVRGSIGGYHSGCLG